MRNVSMTAFTVKAMFVKDHIVASFLLYYTLPVVSMSNQLGLSH